MASKDADDHVFLSFRPQDACRDFTHRLYKSLLQAGIVASFKSRDDELRSESELKSLIRISRTSIVVFSENYASSTQCLNELEEIMECKRTIGQLVLPVFYDVDPSHVRRQTGSFGESLSGHDQRRFAGKLERWRTDLTDVANLSGWDLRDLRQREESKFIQKIVGCVLCEVDRRYMNVALHPVGINSRVEYVISLLSIGSKDVQRVGIYGMGGVGKTTIAKAVYNSISYLFEATCFLANVREVSEKPSGLIHLQEQLLAEILKEKNVKVGNVRNGINLMNKILCSKRVLIVLDDLDDLNQLKSLAGEEHCFGSGSKVLITTRNMFLLKQVDETYKAKELDYEESMELFSWHAFGENVPSIDHGKLTTQILAHAKGLPLALVVLGTYLHGRTITEWRSALKKLQQIPNGEVVEILKISFDALDDDNTKSVFLDIVCFFIGKNKDDTISILNACGFPSEDGVRVLTDRCLLAINENNELRMHDLLQDMGRNIIRKESPKEPGKRSRLWSSEEVCDVLKHHKGTDATEVIMLALPMSKDLLHFSAASFLRMRKLRLLQINNVQLSGSFDGVFEGLRWLGWHYCPLKYLPPNFAPNNLVSLDLQYSKVNTLWKGIKMLPNLKILNLNNSRFLTTTPDFTGVPNLEKLLLCGCKNLYEIHPSIGLLSRLVILILIHCENLRDLPSSICNLRSLELLDLTYCSKLERLPEQLGNMASLKKIFAKKTSIRNLPDSTGLLRNLTELSLGDYNRNLPTKWWSSFFPSWKLAQVPTTKRLPHSFSGFCSLRELYLEHCCLFDGDIPEDVGTLSSLRRLFLSHNSFHSLPSSLGHLSNLEVLSVNHCSSLVSIPQLSSSLHRLHAVECSSLNDLPNLSNLKHLKELHLTECKRLSEVQGLEDLNSVSVIRMDGCQKLASTFSDSFFEGLIENDCQSKMYFSRRDIPVWFTHRRIGSSISFDMPVEKDNKFLGMILWIVYRKEVFCDFDDLDVITINNKTSGTKWTYLDFWPDAGKVIQSWASKLPIRYPIRGGDRIDVSVRGVGLKVYKCGIHLVYKPDIMEVKPSSCIITEIENDECDDRLPTSKEKPLI